MSGLFVWQPVAITTVAGMVVLAACSSPRSAASGESGDEVGNGSDDDDESGDAGPPPDLPTCVPDERPGQRVTKVDVEGTVACAMFEGGGIKCWGYNIWGQLGYGHTQNIGTYDTPADHPFVDVGGCVKDISVSEFSVCALLHDDSVRCWGAVSAGVTIGDDEPARDAPARHWSGALPVKVDVSNGSMCVLLSDGTFDCWHYTAPSFLDIPERFTGPASTICTRDGMICAREAGSGELHCWGPKDVGYPDSALYGYPIDPETKKIGSDEHITTTHGTASDILACDHLSCMVDGDDPRRRLCWGMGKTSMLGDEQHPAYPDADPEPQGGWALSEFPEPLVDVNRLCAVDVLGDVRCSGPFQTNLTGDWDTPTSELPAIDLGAKAVSVTGTYVACVLTEQGTVRCWGGGEYYGVLGYGLGPGEDVGDDETPAEVGDVPFFK
jgi:hypothetical protein